MTAPLLPSTSAPLHPGPPAPWHPGTSAPPHPCASAPPHLLRNPSRDGIMFAQRVAGAIKRGAGGVALSRLARR